jgi:hypothetical protein
MKWLSVLFSGALLMVAGCGLFSDDESDDLANRLFPLNVGEEWTYEVTDSSLDPTQFPPDTPYTFTTSVLGTHTIAGKRYFLLHNYYIPGPYLPDTVLVRNEGERVFIRLHPEDDELLFYSFAPPDTGWAIPLYANPDLVWQGYANLENWSDHYATVRWFAHQESYWQEIFSADAGRVQIRSFSQAYAYIVWTLKRPE